MRIPKDNLKVALVGDITGKLPLEAISEFHKPSTIILNGYYGNVPEQARKWCEANSIPVKEISVHYPSSGFPSEEDYRVAATKLVDEADMVFIFYDYIPSSYDHYYPEKAPVLEHQSQYVKDVADSLDKPVVLFKLEKVYHYHFMIPEDDKDVSTYFFTIDVGSKDINEATAKGIAVAEAQMKYLKYIHSFNRTRTLYFSLKIEEDRCWKEIDTTDLEKWYSNIIKSYQKA